MTDGWFGKVWCTVHDAQPRVGGPGYYKEAEEASEPWGTSQLSSMENKSMATTLVPSSRFSLPSLSAQMMNYETEMTEILSFQRIFEEDSPWNLKFIMYVNDSSRIKLCQMNKKDSQNSLDYFQKMKMKCWKLQQQQQKWFNEILKVSGRKWKMGTVSALHGVILSIPMSGFPHSTLKKHEVTWQYSLEMKINGEMTGIKDNTTCEEKKNCNKVLSKKHDLKTVSAPYW